MRYSNIQESFFDFLRFVSDDEEKRIIQRVDEYLNNNPDFTYDLEFNLPGLCPIERIAQSLVINEGKLRKVLKNVAKKTNAIGIASVSSKVWSGDVLISLNSDGNFKLKSSSYKRSGVRESENDSDNNSSAYLNESFLSALKKTFGFGTSIDKEELDNAALEVVKFLYDRPVYDYHKKSDTPGLIFLSLLSEDKYTSIPFKTLEELFKSDVLENCEIVKFKYKDIEGPLVIFGKPDVSRKEYLIEHTADFTEMLLIKEIQRKLIEKGFLNDYNDDFRRRKSSISGELTKATITALISFQEKYKIPTVRRGDINIETLRKLGVNLSFLGIDLNISETPLIEKLKKEAESIGLSLASKVTSEPKISSIDAPIYKEDGSDDYEDDYGSQYSSPEEEGEIVPPVAQKLQSEPKTTDGQAPKSTTGGIAESGVIVDRLLNEWDMLKSYTDSVQNMSIKTETSILLMSAIGDNSKLSESAKKEVLSKVLYFILQGNGKFFQNVGGFDKFQGDLNSLVRIDWIGLRSKLISYINNPENVSKDKTEGKQVSDLLKQELQTILSNYGITPTSSFSSFTSLTKKREDMGSTTTPFVNPELDDEDEDEEIEISIDDSPESSSISKEEKVDVEQDKIKVDVIVSKLMDKNMFDFYNSFTKEIQNKQKIKSKGMAPTLRIAINKVFGPQSKLEDIQREAIISELLEVLMQNNGLFYQNLGKAPFIKKFFTTNDIDKFNLIDYKNLGSSLIDFILFSDIQVANEITTKLNSLYAKYSS